jgi:hypothetical protein
MIEQKRVEIGATTAPTLVDISKKITDAVEATTGTAFARLKTWLQMPTDSTFKGALDKDCKVRAAEVGNKLSTGGKAYQPGSLSAMPNAKATWASIDKKLATGVAVTVEGASSHVCGDKSYFPNEHNTGFHVIVFLAAGDDSDGKHFYLGFDPDVSATEASRTKWNEVVSASTNIKEVTDTEQSTAIIKAMLLGDSTHAFGPLIRKYYVDIDKKFPPIVRA